MKMCVCVLIYVVVYSRSQAKHLFVVLLFVLGGYKHNHATGDVWRSDDNCLEFSFLPPS